MPERDEYAYTGLSTLRPDSQNTVSLPSPIGNLKTEVYQLEPPQKVHRRTERGLHSQDEPTTKQQA